MKYRQPYGVSDPDAPYVDRSTPGATSGSRPPGKAIEHTQREIVNAILSAGLTPDGNDVTQLAKAIDLKIGQATGGGASPVDDLMVLLRARNPVFPEINTTDGTFNLSAPAAGTVRIPAGITITHRGCFNLVTVEQDFATMANKTYHLRWLKDTGWTLKDVADSAYNPGALVDGAADFDTTYDNMISHRIMTNGANIAAFTPLKNRNVLATQAIIAGTNPRNTGGNGSARDFTDTYNWARRPSSFALSPAQWTMVNTVQPPFDFLVALFTAGAPTTLGFDVDRYRIRQSVMCDYSNSLTMHFSARA